MLVVGLSAALIAGQIARKKLASQFPPPGTIVAMPAGHHLQVFCEGRGPVTVLLEAGLNDFSLHYFRLQPLLAKTTKTCAYDRAGLGWSEPASRPATIDNAVDDLRTVIQSTANNQPLILVGHSYGALIVRRYAEKFPNHILAIDLLDPANEYQAGKITGYKEALTSAAGQFKSLDILSALGVMAFSPQSIPANSLQGTALKEYRAVLASGSFFKGAAAETAAMADNLKFMQADHEKLPISIPVTIFSRGQPEPIPGLPEKSADNLEQTWAGLQADLVKRLNAKQISAVQSNHFVQIKQPELVYELIQQQLEQWKKRNVKNN